LLQLLAFPVPERGESKKECAWFDRVSYVTAIFVLTIFNDIRGKQMTILPHFVNFHNLSLFLSHYSKF
jgi:hypothetical protein